MELSADKRLELSMLPVCPLLQLPSQESGCSWSGCPEEETKERPVLQKLLPSHRRRQASCLGSLSFTQESQLSYLGRKHSGVWAAVSGQVLLALAFFFLV